LTYNNKIIVCTEFDSIEALARRTSSRVYPSRATKRLHCSNAPLAQSRVKCAPTRRSVYASYSASHFLRI